MNRSRIRVAITALALTAGVGLTACSQPAPAPTPGPSADPASSPTHDAPAAAAPIAAAPAAIAAAPAATAARRNPARSDSSLADGQHPARITAVDAEGQQVTFDVVQFFYGDEAADVRNVNPRLRTLPVAPNAPITVNSLSWDETGDSLKDNTAISLSKLASYDRVSSPIFWIATDDGIVTSITEHWMP